MRSLNKRQKAKVRRCLVLVVVSLLLRRVDEETGKTGEPNPAVNQLVKMIDDYLNPETDADRGEMAKRVDIARRKLTKKVADVGTHIGLIGSLRILTGDTFKSTPGTRFDYIQGTMRKNLANIENTLPAAELSIKSFEGRLLVVINQI